jgi:hypothetical protein
MFVLSVGRQSMPAPDKKEAPKQHGARYELKLPIITALQFAVLSNLKSGCLPHSALLDRLSVIDGFKDGPGYCMLMQRLDKSGLVKRDWSRIENRIGNPWIRVYSITARGEMAIREARSFYGATSFGGIDGRAG